MSVPSELPDDYEVDSSDLEPPDTGRYRFDPDQPTRVALHMAEGHWIDLVRSKCMECGVNIRAVIGVLNLSGPI